MTRCKIVSVAMATLAAVLSIGASSMPASAQAYPACAPGYYYSAGYCYPYNYGYPPAAYYPPVYSGAPFFFPSVGFAFGFHDHFHDHFHDGFHSGVHGGSPMMSGGFHGGGFHR